MPCPGSATPRCWFVAIGLWAALGVGCSTGTEHNLDAGGVDADWTVHSPDGGDGGAADGGANVPWSYGVGPVDPAWTTAAPECRAEDFLRKYFAYRERLVGNASSTSPRFIDVGAGAAMSLPASLRDPTANCANDWRIHAGCVAPPIPNTRGIYEYGDTTIWLGWYIAALATEYPMLKKLGLPTTRTEHELALALQAFNRLDLAAETMLGYPAQLDGIFVREDIPFDFPLAPGGGPRFPRTDAYAGYGCVSVPCAAMEVGTGRFESQDQVIGLFLGFALIHKLIPPGVVSDGIDLLNETQAITHRITMGLRNHDWKIIAANGEQPPAQWGGSALGFSDAIARAANRITENKLGIADYRNFLSDTAGKFSMTGADLSWSVQTYVNMSLAIKMAVVNDDWPTDKMATRSSDLGTPAFAIMHSLLHGRPLDPSMPVWELSSNLALAPCSGPCNLVEGCEAPMGWRGPHRLKDGEYRGGNNRGEFNGMDYLTIHNLLVILRDGAHEVQVTPAAPSCDDSNDPLAWLGHAAPSAASVDLNGACATRQLTRRFCGRTLASWIDASLRGEVGIVTGGKRWACAADGVCAFVAAGATDGQDLLIGTDGNDVLDGLGGADCIYGLAGDDDLSGRGGRDELHGGDGKDLICGESCGVGELVGDEDLVFGGAGDDWVHGGPGNDFVQGGDGADHLEGALGEDALDGEGGNDEIEGNAGKDLLEGGPGDDLLRGGDGDDLCRGGIGRDRLAGGGGNDVLAGGDGDDFLMGDGDDDRMWGENGDDRLCGGCGTDELDGGWSSLDACRGKGISWPCNTSTSDNDNTIQGCGPAVLSESDCDDPAFDAW